MNLWMLEVPSRFCPEHLPPGLDCYFRLPGRMVMVWSRGEPVLVFLRGEDQLVCNCPEYNWKQECRHTQALQAGLWVHIFQRPQGCGLVTCTQDWVRKGRCSATIRVPLTQEMSVAV